MGAHLHCIEQPRYRSERLSVDVYHNSYMKNVIRSEIRLSGDTNIWGRFISLYCSDETCIKPLGWHTCIRFQIKIEIIKTKKHCKEVYRVNSVVKIRVMTSSNFYSSTNAYNNWNCLCLNIIIGFFKAKYSMLWRFLKPAEW